jgi:hypothetical protein
VEHVIYGYVNQINQTFISPANTYRCDIIYMLLKWTKSGTLRKEWCRRSSDQICH